jgi:hypothetical protein
MLSILIPVVEWAKAACDSIDKFAADAKTNPRCRIVGLIPQKHKL